MSQLSKGNLENRSSITLPSSKAFLSPAISFAEKTAIALGLDNREAMAVTLAIEEIFTYLCGITFENQVIEIIFSGRGHYIAIEIVFSAEKLNIRAFNITSAISPDDETEMEEMGLLIASRFVDRLRVNYSEDKKYRMLLIKEKAYPDSAEEPVPSVGNLDNFEIRTPNPEELKLLSRHIQYHYRDAFFPSALHYPGKLVDMVNGGEYAAMIASDSKGHIGGGIIWHYSEGKTVECWGPYVFDHNPGLGLAGRLLEDCIAAVAKTPAISLLNRYPVEEFSGDYFELLGTLEIADSSGNTREIPSWYRQLNEDLGASIWAPSEIEHYLRLEYDRLFLPREIRLVRYDGESDNLFSVLSVDFDRSSDSATMHPVQAGRDIAENLRNHLQLFMKESVNNLFFEMDLGIYWHSYFAPALVSEGFIPRLILPYGGKGDIVVFQRGGIPE
ncbi:MAG: hypothetical protein GX654_17550 [Desulfatiglans sp.]|jgi:anti-sigma regulatory factor (Ser/Thr protein kinase)|nr:hypothetical protein [Desulfatiglans sp.]